MICRLWTDGFSKNTRLIPSASTARFSPAMRHTGLCRFRAAAKCTERIIDDEIKGGGNTTVNDEPFFRFVIAMKYPDGVSQEDGEKWFYDSFIPAMKNQKDLLRGFSYKGIEPHVTPFTRIVELWYRDSNSWIRNWVDGKPKINAPSWSSNGQNAMYLTPYKDMVCIFLEESPERDFLKQGTAYYTDN